MQYTVKEIIEDCRNDNEDESLLHIYEKAYDRWPSQETSWWRGSSVVQGKKYIKLI